MGFNQFALMARSFLKCSPIYNNENLPNIKKLPLWAQNFEKESQKSLFLLPK